MLYKVIKSNDYKTPIQERRFSCILSSQHEALKLQHVEGYTSKPYLLISAEIYRPRALPRCSFMLLRPTKNRQGVFSLLEEQSTAGLAREVICYRICYLCATEVAAVPLISA